MDIIIILVCYLIPRENTFFLYPSFNAISIVALLFRPSQQTLLYNFVIKNAINPHGHLYNKRVHGNSNLTDALYRLIMPLLQLTDAASNIYLSHGS